MRTTVDSTPLTLRDVRVGAATAATALALAVTAQTYLAMLDHGHSFWRLLLWQLWCWGFWVAAAPWPFAQGTRLALEGDAGRWRGPVVVGVGLILVHVPLAAGATVILQPYTPVSVYDLRGALVLQLGVLLTIDVLACATLVASGYGLAAYHRARELDLRQSRLEHELTRAHLETLRLEIQPHFLFNTLNTVAALIRRRSHDAALTTLVSLSDLLRASLERHKDPVTTIRAELEFARRYVDLQQTRFADRLEVVFDVADGCEACVMPTLALQPLVENAFRHAVSRRDGRCRIEIGARRDGDQVRLWVRDDGPGLPPGFALDRDGGVGLRNTTSRLRELFGPSARLTVRPGDRAGTVSEIRLPATLATPLERVAVS